MRQQMWPCEGLEFPDWRYSSVHSFYRTWIELETSNCFFIFELCADGVLCKSTMLTQQNAFGNCFGLA